MLIDDKNVALLFDVLNPEKIKEDNKVTIRQDNMVTLLFNVAKPDTFNDEINV